MAVGSPFLRVDFGNADATALPLFLLVVPAMVFNIRRSRRGRS